MPVDTLEVEANVASSIGNEEADALRHAVVAEWLIDNDAAYMSIIHAIRGARRSVCITQLAFDADCEHYASDQRPIRLLDELVTAWRAHALDVRILLNATLLVDTARPLRAALARMDADAIEVRGISLFPQLLHAKVMIIDDREAFLIGSPFVNGYWDDSSHRPDDARRPMRELGGRPMHDLSVRLAGPIVADLQGEFEELWRSGMGEHAIPVPATQPPSAAPTVMGGANVMLTTPRRLDERMHDGRAEIIPAMLRGIGSARDLLYIEHQYLSSRRVVRALADALSRRPQLEIITLVNQNPDVTAYRGWQNQRLQESGLGAHSRFGLFAPWSAAVHNGAIALNQVFVHSKLIVADDRWATFGSANIDGVSLHSYGADFQSRLGERIFRNVRNIDLNVELRGADDATEASITELRTKLWREHIGELPSTRPHGGWLRHWRLRAAENIEALNGASEDVVDGPLILPYSTAPTPRAQLTSLGVLERKELDLRFHPSWLEVYCSPNWIRNMFA
jgi:phosphatidylserine/phosphatidylglycerophosphate/cardiolipin synthase-like enzyme